MADSYPVNNQWSNDLASCVGKFEVAPTPQAQIQWDIVKKFPHLYEFGISYIEHEDGTKELVGISLITKKPPKGL